MPFPVDVLNEAKGLVHGFPGALANENQVAELHVHAGFPGEAEHLVQGAQVVGAPAEGQAVAGADGGAGPGMHCDRSAVPLGDQRGALELLIGCVAVGLIHQPEGNACRAGLQLPGDQRILPLQLVLGQGTAVIARQADAAAHMAQHGHDVHGDIP